MSDREHRPHEAATLAGEAQAAVEAQRDGPADALQSFADSIQEKAAMMPGGDSTSNASAAVAGGLEHTADVVHELKSRQTGSDLTALLRQRPIVAIGAGVVIGFLVGRLSK